MNKHKTFTGAVTFTAGNELMYSPGGIYVTVEEVHDNHMIVKDLDTNCEFTIPEAEYELYSLLGEGEEA